MQLQMGKSPGIGGIPAGLSAWGRSTAGWAPGSVHKLLGERDFTAWPQRHSHCLSVQKQRRKIRLFKLPKHHPTLHCRQNLGSRHAEQTYHNNTTGKHARKPVRVQVQQRDNRHDLDAEVDLEEVERTEYGSLCSSCRPNQGLWYCQSRWTVANSGTHLRQLHESQQGQVKHSWSLSGSFPISNSIKQRCVLAPTLFSIFCSIMLCEAKEDLPDGINIHFQTDGSVFTFGIALHAWKPFRNLSLSCCLMMSAPFSSTYRKPYSTSSTISMMQPRTLASPSANPLHEKHTVLLRSALMATISLQWNTLLTCVHNATVSKDLEDRLFKASTSFGRLSKRVWQSHSFFLSTKIQVYRAIIVPTLLYDAETWVL